MQSKVAALWQMQEAKKKDAPQRVRIVPAEDIVPVENEEAPTAAEAAHLAESLAHLEKMMPELFAEEEPGHHQGIDKDSTEAPVEFLSAGGSEEIEHDLETPVKRGKEEAIVVSAAPVSGEPVSGESLSSEPIEAAELAAAPPKAQPENWSSAASARQFLEQLASNRNPSLVRFWNTHRGDVYLAVAVILVLCVIRWGMWSSHSVTAAPNAAAAVHHKAPEPEISLFDRMLIGVGLADPPEAPEDKGDPSIVVWVDTRTALYYCPGTDLYQKTPKGKLETQREAQLDQFQAAYRKACE
jgi:hypothetical protein